MRVCHVTDAFHPLVGGVERVVAGLALKQVEMGLRVRVITKAVPGAQDFELWRGIEIERVPFSPSPTPAAYRSTITAVRDALRSMVSSGSAPDIVHAHLTLTGVGGLRAARESGIPMVSTFYGPWYSEFLKESEQLMQRGMLYGMYLRYLARRQRAMQGNLLRSSDARIALSEHSEGVLERKFDVLDAVRIPGGADLDALRPIDRAEARRRLGWSIDGIIILSLRRLVRRMGLDDLIRASAILADRGFDLTLVIAGEGPIAGELADLARSTGLGERVMFTGLVPETELNLVMSAADLFAIPSVAEEHFGLVILESIACGTPVVGTPVGAIPEILGRFSSDLVADGVGPGPLASAIQRALERLKELSAFCHGEWRKKLIDDYSWGCVARRTLEVYQSVLSDRAGR